MKNCLVRIGIPVLVLIIAYAAIRPYLGANLRSENFPLREKWSTRLQGDIQQLTVADKTTLIARTNVAIYAVDIPTGTIRWRRWTDWSTPREPVIAVSGMLFFADGGRMWALNQANGAVVLQQKLFHGETADVIHANQNYLAVRDGDYLNLFRAEGGEVFWRKPICRGKFSSYIKDSLVYTLCYGLSALDVGKGETVWEMKMDRVLPASRFLEDVVYYSPDGERVIAFDLEDRIKQWSATLPADGVFELEVDRDILFVSLADQLCAINRSDGTIVWCASDLNGPNVPTRLGKNIYVFNTFLDEITALEAATGNQIGQLTRSGLKSYGIDSNLHIMAATNDLLIFGSVKHLFAYGE